MMFLERLQANPLRALIWVEIGAFALAFSADVIVGLFVPLHVPLSLKAHIPLYALAIAITAIATFRIPHAPNRRYLSMTVAALGLAAAGTIPSPGGTPFVLLMILASRMTFAFGFSGTAIVWLVSLLAIIANAVADLHYGAGRHRSLMLNDVIATTYTFSVQNALVMGIIGMMWVYARKAAASAALGERMRIALDLHDSLGHGLTTLALQLQNADRLRDADPEKAHAYLQRASSTTTEILGDVREAVAMLHDDERPPSLSLMLDRLRSDFAAAHEMKMHWNVRMALEPSGRISMALYRVLQEALTNVARHAEASQVDVRVDGRDEWIELRVHDDGRGIAEDSSAGHGLVSMRSRIESAGGTFSMTSQPGAGTYIIARIPLEAAS